MSRVHPHPSSRSENRQAHLPDRSRHFGTGTRLLRRKKRTAPVLPKPWWNTADNPMAILESRDCGKTFHIVCLTPEAERLDPAPEDPIPTEVPDRLPLLQDIDVANALTRAWRTGTPSLLSNIYFNTGTRSGWRNVFIFRMNRHRVGIIYEDITSYKEAQQHHLQNRKLEALGTFARGVSHELNNILMAVSGFTDLALTHCENARTSSYLKHIRDAHERAESLVRQLHFFSRTGQNSMDPVFISLLIRECLKTFRATLPETLELHLDLDPRLHHVMGDPSLLHQMLMQLLHNAAQAAPEKGGRMSVTAENIVQKEDPLLSECSEHDWIKIEIRDSGPGMPPNIQDRIFDPFFTTNPLNGRLGLGLAVVHGIVRAHNGFLSHHAVQGQGCSFRILLPGVPASTKVPSPPQRRESDARARHVLIIDDQPELLLMQQEGLEGLGFRTTCCKTGEEGVRTYMHEGDTIDIVLVDYTMPGMNGLEVAQKIHSLSFDPPPILLCTGFLPIKIRNTLNLSHITDILYKPVSIEALAARLRELPATATKEGS